MKTLYFQCDMGAAGDMIGAALLELTEDKEKYIKKLNKCGIPEVEYSIENVSRCGIYGTKLNVTVNGVEEGADGHHHHQHDEHDHYDGHDHHHHDEHDHHDGHDHEHGKHEHDHGHHHHHASLADIEAIVEKLDISDKIKKDVMNIYTLIAEAESHAHNMPVTEIHFHEVGTMDAIADITAACFLIDKLDVDRIITGPVNTGSGQVKCAHGILPVPAPATAYLLTDIPAYQGEIKSELCTPTGAAILKYFSDDFGPMPAMKIKKTGYGMGSKEFEAANCIRAFIGKTENIKKKNDESEYCKEDSDGGECSVAELSCNIDDMTGEEIGFAMERLFDAGALEVFTTPVGMKKCRPGTKITVLCGDDIKDEIVKAIFKYTSTIGIREYRCRRYVLKRSEETADTKYGKIRKKISEGYGVRREKTEYDDLARIASKTRKSISQIRSEIDV